MKKLSYIKLVVFALLIFSTGAMACKCKTLASINKEEANQYDVIFYGKVDSVGACDEKGIAIAYFTIEELYKGNLKQHNQIHFDCASDCLMSFAKGEEWIIYGKYQRFDEIKVSLCDHNRRKAQAGEQDFYEAVAQRTFDQEKEFLKTELGTHSFIQDENWNKNQEELKPRNEQPSGMSKIVLLLVSFGVMIIIYIITRKKKNKNG
ncbi:MAG TPA: hypothetical protein PK289_02695 [Bacteroidia bacterium]|nr:hypothetical protein [Bacteroidia bacterium]